MSQALMRKRYMAPPKAWEAKLPLDVVAEQHKRIHAELDRWGRWNREKLQAGKCGGVEANYDAGGRESKRAVVVLPPDPLMHQIDRVARAMTLAVPRHGETVKLYYCGRLERRTMYVRCDPHLICRIMSIHWDEFPSWMAYCRAMVINLLRRDGVTL